MGIFEVRQEGGRRRDTRMCRGLQRNGRWQRGREEGRVLGLCLSVCLSLSRQHAFLIHNVTTVLSGMRISRISSFSLDAVGLLVPGVVFAAHKLPSPSGQVTASLTTAPNHHFYGTVLRSTPTLYSPLAPLKQEQEHPKKQTPCIQQKPVDVDGSRSMTIPEGS